MTICPCGIARDDCDYHKPAPVVPQVPVYDVSGTCFVVGVTNFTIENLYDASLPATSGLMKIIVHTALYHRIRKCNLLDILPNGTETLQGFPIQHNPNFPKTGGVFDSLLVHKDGKEVILRTREH
jgi:hypothetical protein